MNDTTLQEKLREIFEKMLSIAGFDFEKVSCREEQPGLFRCEVFTKDAGLLIGERGTYLSAWEQVLKAMATKALRQPAQIIVDINNYRAQKDEELREMAKKAARQAAISKKPIALPPMNAYERKVIHLELALRPDVMTESEGEEPNRRVVVKPI
ncbi:MAG: protein jag [Candidatus Paceibacteria bacterium]